MAQHKKATTPHKKDDTETLSSREQAMLGFFERKVKPNLHAILWAVATLVIVVLFVVNMMNRRTARAATGFTMLDYANTVTALDDVALQYEGAYPGEMAVLRKAARLMQEERFAEASDVYRAFVRDYSASRLRYMAELGLAYALESQDNYREAAAVFSELGSGDPPNDYVRAEAACGAGRCLAAEGRLAEARDWYETVISLGGDGYFTEQARYALRDIGAALKPAGSHSEGDSSDDGRL